MASIYVPSDPPAKASRGNTPATRTSDDADDGNLPSAGTYKHCRKFIFSAVTGHQHDMVRCHDSTCKDGFLIFEVVDIVKLCQEVMRARESTLKGKWLTTIRDAHIAANEYLVSAVCKKPVALRGLVASVYHEQLNGKLLTYARDKKQRRAWEAFKEFLKR
jgi:hypothetical protein